MRKLFTILVPIAIGILLTASVFAQAPEKMSYQAVIRNSSDALVTNTQIGMEINIRQGSVSGTVVYTETQTPTTNANGLVSIEIGGGAGFNAIDWSVGPYFIETKTAVVPPLTTYTITGTSQLLSVPYALHAKTAESVIGGITETDPTYTSSEAANITASDITNLGNLSGTNTGDQDLSTLATKTELGDSTAQVRSEIPDVSGFLTSETDPTYTSSEAANITATDISNLGNLSGTNTGDQDLSGLATKTALGDSTAQVRSEIPDVSGFLTSETDPVFIAWDKDYADLINPPTTITTTQANAIADNSGKDTTGIYHANRTALDLVSGTNTGDQDISGIATNEQAIQDTASQIRADIPDVSGFLSSETDPVYTAWDKDYADLINTPAAADGSETKVTAGTNVTVTGTGTDADPYEVSATAGGATTYSVGDFAQGGIVFWVDETGQHGLVCAKEDQSTGVRWYAGTYGNTQAKGDGPYAGEANTSIIIAAQVAIGDDGSTYAARICNELQITEGGKTYGDWYLPSKAELNLMYQNKATIDATATSNSGSGFASAYYWSSTEYNNYNAWGQSFGHGAQNDFDKFYTGYVRAVLAF